MITKHIDVSIWYSCVALVFQHMTTSTCNASNNKRLLVFCIAIRQFNKMAKSHAEKSVEIIVKTEDVADKILANKNELVELDKRRQYTRVAIRRVENEPEQKVWISIGSMLVKMKREKALELLKNDQRQIDMQINIIKSEQKVLVNKHRDLEMLGPFSGTSLKPLEHKQIQALKANYPLMG